MWQESELKLLHYRPGFSIIASSYRTSSALPDKWVITFKHTELLYNIIRQHLFMSSSFTYKRSAVMGILYLQKHTYLPWLNISAGPCKAEMCHPSTLHILAFDWTGVRDSKNSFVQWGNCSVQLTLSTGLLIISASQLLSSPGTSLPIERRTV